LNSRAEAADILHEKPPEKPRYQQLADELRARILSGQLASNNSFPTESALCAEYGVSRFTVREALRRLQGEGLIARRRGSGTVVQPAAARGGALHQPLSNVGEILQYARDTRIAYDHLGLQSLPRSIAVQVAMPVSHKWFRFRGVRRQTADGQPIALTDAYVIAELADAVANILPPRDAPDQQINPGSNTLFQFISNAAGLAMSRVTQDIQAVPASAEIAAALDIPRRSACLRIIRCYHDQDGRMFEMSVSHHPGDRFAYSMHIEVEG
jgi:DNA-binding GntR family transcriptional regulator